MYDHVMMYVRYLWGENMVLPDPREEELSPAEPSPDEPSPAEPSPAEPSPAEPRPADPRLAGMLDFWFSI